MTTVEQIQKILGVKVDDDFGNISAAAAVYKLTGKIGTGTLRALVGIIQKELGVKIDGLAGPITFAALLARLERGSAVTPTPIAGVDARSQAKLDGLDPKAATIFAKFLLKGKEVAAAFGYDYRIVQGTRTMAEQAELYAKGRTSPGPKVTNAKPGSSWHNFGVSVDFGVFKDSEYIDDKNGTLADKIHTAVAKHAAEYGLEWGGSWTSIKDVPHFQIGSLPSSPNAKYKKLFEDKGSVL